MKKSVLLFAALAATACLAPEGHTAPEDRSPTMTVTSTEITFGADATAGALRDVSMELSNPDALALAARERGQSVEERRAVLAETLRDLELQLEEHPDDHASSAACVRHRDAGYRTRNTRVELNIIHPGSGIFYVTSYTAATRTTDITQSTYMEINAGGGFYFPYIAVDHPTGCGIAMRTNVVGTYDLDLALSRTYDAYAETSHLLPLTTLGMSWTFATDSYTGTVQPGHGEEH